MYLVPFRWRNCSSLNALITNLGYECTEYIFHHFCDTTIFVASCLNFGGQVVSKMGPLVKKNNVPSGLWAIFLGVDSKYQPRQSSLARAAFVASVSIPLKWISVLAFASYICLFYGKWLWFATIALPDWTF